MRVHKHVSLRAYKDVIMKAYKHVSIQVYEHLSTQVHIPLISYSPQHSSTIVKEFERMPNYTLA